MISLTITIIWASILLVYSLWIFFLAVMNLKRAQDMGKLSKTARLLGLPILAIGYLLDLLSNMVPMTILFLEIPKETLVTRRVCRHIHDSTGYRLKLALWFKDNLLDNFDPTGNHCGGQ